MESAGINRHWITPNRVPLIPSKACKGYGLFSHDKHGQHNPDYMVPEGLS